MSSAQDAPVLKKSTGMRSIVAKSAESGRTFFYLKRILEQQNLKGTQAIQASAGESIAVIQDLDVAIGQRLLDFTDCQLRMGLSDQRRTTSHRRR